MKSFPAKILLFGEYAVIKGSNALAVPFGKMSGGIIKPNSWTMKLKQSNQHLKDLLEFLQNDGSFSWLDLSAFQFEADSLAFETNIPIGYGAGSSGALVAAVYDRYKLSEAKDHSKTQQRLAAMEACFHGQSSGLDPLVSYLGKAVCTNGGSNLDLIEVPALKDLYLLDTGKARSTAPLVKIFKEKLLISSFESVVEKLSIINKAAIESLIHQDFEALFDAFSGISKIQWEHFQEMIPEAYQQVWKEGLEKEGYSVKLCGAGGGGFLLLMANPHEKYSSNLPSNLLSLS